MRTFTRPRGAQGRPRLLVAIVIAAASMGPGLADDNAKPDAKSDAKPKSSRSKRARPVNLVNDAYEAIKRERKKLIDKYLKALFVIADDCVKKKLPLAGKRITDRILKVVEPPKNRRKVISTSSGVAVAADGERVTTGDEPAVREVKQKPLTPEEEAQLKEVRDRVAAIRSELGIDAKGRIAGPGADQPPPFQPGGDPDDGGESTGTKKGKTAVAKKKASGAAPGDAKAAKEELTREESDVDQRERSARNELMKSVEKLAVKCVEQRFPGHAYEILLWAIGMDPDNKDLRRNVRQHEHKDKSGKVEWYSPYEMTKVKAGYFQHPEYGWVTPSEVKALSAGKLWFKNQWRPREEVDAERQKWENRWIYETEHYKIHTNADLKDAVLFGREVERLYAFFFRVFIDFYSTGNAGEDSKMVFGGGKDLGKKKLELHYYRSREHFLSEIARDPECNRFPNPPGKDPLIAQSAGFYWGATHKAYFYRGPTGPDLSTLYHEVTHQIFGETYGSGPNPPTWLVEGFGVFMEDPVIRGERLLAGAEPPPGVKPDNPRDLNDFVKNCQNHNEFHGGRRGNNYATAGAVVHFFLFYKGGLYRTPFMQYAREAYRNMTDNTPTDIKKLYECLNVPESQLQEDWAAFLAKPDLFDF